MKTRYCAICHKVLVRKVFTKPESRTVCQGCRYLLQSNSEETFWSKVLKSDNDKCWEWQGKIKPNGYGMFAYKKKYWYVHRLAYILSIGEIPQNKQINHRCDNRKCCNPHHLYAGTHKENTQDMIQRNRINPPIGERNAFHKLTSSDVLYIREEAQTRNTTRRQLAKQFQVSLTTIQAIVKRRKWKHI